MGTYLCRLFEPHLEFGESQPFVLRILKLAYASIEIDSD